MKGIKMIFTYVLIFTACFVMTLLLFIKPVRCADSLSSTLFTPPLSDKEMQLYKETGNDETEIKKFIETRLYIRKLNTFIAELPKGLDYDQLEYGNPRPNKYVDINYALNFDEQLALYVICLSCGCGDEGLDSSNPNCNRDHPSQIECGNPVDKESILSQLKAPVSEEELNFFEKANKCAQNEIPRFLVTRKYIRQIKELIATIPVDKKWDAHTAPQIPDLVDSSYLTATELSTMMDIQAAWIENSVSQKR